MDTELTLEERLCEALDYLCVNTGGGIGTALLIDSALEEEFSEELLAYVLSHPGISLHDLWEAASFYWLPPIIVSDDPVDSEAMMEYQERIFQKLSRLVTCEKDAIRIYHEIVHPSLQFLFYEELEQYVDDHPDADYEEIKAYSKQIWKEKDAEISANHSWGEDDHTEALP